MDAAALKALQAPLKDKYREAPEAAVVTLKAEGRIGEGVTCRVETGKALLEAGLHPATGGPGTQACSGDMLLEALVACAGVTLNAVATALGLTVRDAVVRAEGDLDFRGTLGVAKDAPVGFREIRLTFDIDGDLTRGAARHAHEAHRALLRGLPDAAHPAADRGDEPGRLRRAGLPDCRAAPAPKSGLRSDDSDCTPRPILQLRCAARRSSGKKLRDGHLEAGRIELETVGRSQSAWRSRRRRGRDG